MMHSKDITILKMNSKYCNKILFYFWRNDLHEVLTDFFYAFKMLLTCELEILCTICIGSVLYILFTNNY